MKNISNFALAFFFFISATNGQFNPKFTESLEEITTFLDEEIDPVGLSISIRSGNNLWNHTLGISSVEDSLSTSSIFAMGSITKTFTSAAILNMMEDNRLSLSDPLHMYLPSFDNIDSMITIKQLLNHTSGVHNYSLHPDYFDVVFEDQNQFYTYSPEEVLEQFVLEPVFERGTFQEYSNTNYVLLGMIITEIANRPFYEEIFELFDISQNYPSISSPPLNSEISELADLWYDLGNGTENIVELGIGLDGLFSTTGASGAFVGTAADISQWGHDLYSGKLLNESSMDSLFDYSPFLLDGVEEYGLGVSNIPISCEINTVGHGGNLFYEAHLAYSEEYDLSVALMTNDELSFIEFGRLATVAEEIFCAYKESQVTSSEDIIDPMKVEIYPNPVQNFAHIKLPQAFDQSVQVQVYNEIGSLVYTQTWQTDNLHIIKIDYFAELAEGLYFVKILDNENIYTTKLIKG